MNIGTPTKAKAVMAKLDGLPIGDAFPCYIIAEIGQNHQGDLSLAKELILLAKEAGANCVKFQKSSLHDKFTQAALATPYESENSFGVTYGEHKAKLEFSFEQYQELKHFAENARITFTASAMDMTSADFLHSMNVPFIKIGSGDTNNYLMLEHVAKLGNPIVLSTGMQDLETVEQAVGIISKYNSNVALLHCVSAYPTPTGDVNLSIMSMYKDMFPNVVVGYSGHELGIHISIAAVALGAKIVERHFTKDKNLKGTDHKCSLNPMEFRAMVDGIREVERAIGKPNKIILESEIPCQEKLGKSIVSACDIPCGATLGLENLCIKVSRPRGISPQDVFKIQGKKTLKSIDSDEPMFYDDLEPW